MHLFKDHCIEQIVLNLLSTMFNYLATYIVLSSLSIKTVNAKTFKNSYSIRIVEDVAHVVAGAVAASFAVDGDAASAIRPRVTASSAMCSKQSLA